jgi:hypothetical protein
LADSILAKVWAGSFCGLYSYRGGVIEIVEPKKIHIIKNHPDFLLGVIFLALGLFLLLNDGLVGKEMSNLGGYWAQPSTYLKMLGMGISIFSVILLLTSLNFQRTNVIQKIQLNVGFEAWMTILALLVYCIIMPIITFMPATFLMILFINLVYKRKEAIKAAETLAEKAAQERSDSGEEGAVPVPVAPISAEARKKSLITSVIYAVVITLFLWVVFTQFLDAQLP